MEMCRNNRSGNMPSSCTFVVKYPIQNERSYFVRYLKWKIIIRLLLKYVNIKFVYKKVWIFV